MTTVQAADDATPTDWIGPSPELDDFPRLQFGPRLFEAYLRVNLDPNDVDEWVPANPEPDSISDALQVLLGHTSTPEHAYAGIWDGWESRRVSPKAPRITVAGRQLLIFTGTVMDMRFAANTAWNGYPTDGGAEPHWLWPADHSWFLACDVDEQLDFSVGCSPRAAKDLLAHFGPRARLVPYGTE